MRELRASYTFNAKARVVHDFINKNGYIEAEPDDYPGLYFSCEPATSYVWNSAHLPFRIVFAMSVRLESENCWLMDGEEVAEIVFAQEANRCKAEMHIETEPEAWLDHEAKELIVSLGIDYLVSLWQELIILWENPVVEEPQAEIAAPEQTRDDTVNSTANRLAAMMKELRAAMSRSSPDTPGLKAGLAAFAEELGDEPAGRIQKTQIPAPEHDSDDDLVTQIRRAFPKPITENRRTRLVELTQFYRKSGHFLTQEQIAEQFGKSVDTIQDDLRLLKEKGFIETSV